MELSVIIPVYNEEHDIPELHETLARIAAQVTEDYTLICVNDTTQLTSAEQYIPPCCSLRKCCSR